MCGEAGFSTTDAVPLRGEAMPHINVLSVNCSEGDTSLSDCKLEYGVNIQDCQHGVSCKENKGKAIAFTFILMCVSWYKYHVNDHITLCSHSSKASSMTRSPISSQSRSSSGVGGL